MAGSKPAARRKIREWQKIIVVVILSIAAGDSNFTPVQTINHGSSAFPFVTKRWNFIQENSSTNNVDDRRSGKRITFPKSEADKTEEIKAKFKNWNVVDDPEDYNKPVWSPSRRPPAESEAKTVLLPQFPSLDVVEDPGYHHGRPAWPFNEYLGPWRTRSNGSSSTLTNTKDYEWQKLPTINSQVVGSVGGGGWDRSKYFHLDEEQGSNFRKQSTAGEPPHVTQVSTGIKTTMDDGRGAEKHVLPGAVVQPHYFPPDYYPKKKFRLQIHPAYIAAPIAGAVAFGAASAFTKKPILFELGLVNNKRHLPYKPGYFPGNMWGSTNFPVISAPAGWGGHVPILKPEGSERPEFYHYHQHSHKHWVKGGGGNKLHLSGHGAGWGEHQKPGLGWQKPEVGWQKPDFGWQKPEVGWQKPEVGWQKPEVGWQKPEVGWQKPGNGWQKPGHHHHEWDNHGNHGWPQKPTTGWGGDQKPSWGWEHQKPGWTSNPEPTKPSGGWTQGWAEVQRPVGTVQWGWGTKPPSTGWGEKPSCCTSPTPDTQKPGWGWGSSGQSGGGGDNKKPWWNIFAMTPK